MEDEISESASTYFVTFKDQTFYQVKRTFKKNTKRCFIENI